VALKTFTTGEVLTAADTNLYLVNTTAVVKSANESVTSSTTLQDDDELSVSVAANSTYEVTCFLKYDGPTAADLKCQWVVPASATFDFALMRLATTAGAFTDDATDWNTDSAAGSFLIGTIGSGTNAAALFHGVLIVGATAGTFKLQWAQSTSDATPTRILARSTLVLRRIV
jgi:hypothetical protein